MKLLIPKYGTDTDDEKMPLVILPCNLHDTAQFSAFLCVSPFDFLFLQFSFQFMIINLGFTQK